MLLYCLKRLGLALLVIIVVSLVGFFTLRLSGDPAVAMAGAASSQADVENIRRQYGFDRPLIIQYFDWLGRAVSGDFGTSNYFSSAERRVGKECVSTCRCRWTPYH